MPNSKIIRTTPEAQGEKHWTPPAGTLGELTDRAWARSHALGAGRDPDEIATARSGIPSLCSALRGPHLAIIAEIKRRSPSKGIINAAIDSGGQASKYAEGGAAAISVLTEPLRFGGHDRDVAEVRRAVTIPILKKDFHVSEAQLIHAADTEASAALVIVRSVEPSRLKPLASLARALSLEILFEVRDEIELSRAIEAGAAMIGINNRNLETLEVDPGTVGRILPLIPPEIVAIAESGYSSAASVREAAQAGADAVLIGSFFSGAEDPAKAVRSLTGIIRNRREADRH